MNPFSPTSAIVELTTKCNYRCIMCKGSPDKKEYVQSGRDMDDTVVEAVLKQLSRFRRIHLSGEGETLCRRDFVDIWDRMPKGPIYSMSTNGYELTDKVRQTLVARNLEVLYVSLDSVEEHIYDKLRCNKELPRVLNNLKLFDEEKQRQNKQKPYVYWCMIGMKDSIGGLVQFVEEAKARGAKGVILQSLFEKTGTEGQSLLHDVDLLRHWVPRGKKRADELGIEFLVREPYLSLSNGHSPDPKQQPELRRPDEVMTQGCTDPWTYAYFLATGEVACCCYMMPRYTVGRVEDFDQIWNGENLNRIRRGLLGKEKMHEMCQECPSTPRVSVVELKAKLFEHLDAHRPFYWK
jgi:MoaA/NifB/PqqE/SkfB family radical SAM enzyme